MTKVYSFPRGGISLEDPSVPARGPSVVACLPGLSIIPLAQYSGARAYPVVSVGDTVREGMIVARGQGRGSANIHATVPGRVVRTVSWKGYGSVNDALVIRLEGSFEKLGKKEEIFPWEGLTCFELQRIISEYGIVEMEGSGYPVSDMISSIRNSPEPCTLVVSCVFDDPWLAADRLLCQERIGAVAEGALVMSRAGRINRVVFALSRGERDLGEALMAASGGWDIPASLMLAGSHYPQRNRRELELVLRRYAKKESIELGSLLVLGPATLAAVHDAVKLKKPILDRYVAVGGSAVKMPQVMKVRVGTRIGEVFAECGGFVNKPKRIATGSPLQGRPVADLDEPVTRISYAVFAMLENRMARGRAQKCISCGECRAVCPVGLDPEELYKQTLRGLSGAASSRVSARAGTVYASPAGDRGVPASGGCHGCGCCDVVCPSRLPLSACILGDSGPAGGRA
ncbi:MAG: 4Fe-4S dicluster domain-containing protein [Treponema sp.]|nr:4Fe-4S dicluster domain-containing protein [Treponema sp.]